MPHRKTIFVNKEIYHLVNRGINHTPIFNNLRDYNRFLAIIDFLRYEPIIRYSHFKQLNADERKDLIVRLENNNKPLVEIIAFCLMPNHYHLLIRQLRDKGIQTFMRNLQNSYAKYFNARNQRTDHLFQSAFYSKLIETNEHLNHISRYIHLNPTSSYLVNISDLENYSFSSYTDYLGESIHKFVNPNIILKNFESESDYKNFVLDQAEYQKSLNTIKHLTLES